MPPVPATARMPLAARRSRLPGLRLAGLAVTCLAVTGLAMSGANRNNRNNASLPRAGD